MIVRLNCKNQPLVLAAILLASTTLFLYWPTLDHGFICYDDPQYILDNNHITTGFKWSNLIWAFQTGYVGNWHPLTWLCHIADFKLYGLNPEGHHLTSVLLHALNSVLLLLLLNNITETFWRSLLVATIFAWHPIHVESVAWAAELKDVLSTFFWLLALMAYAYYAKKANRISFLISLCLFALGLMSKPMVVTFPFVLLLFDIWPLNRLQTKDGANQPNVVSRAGIPAAFLTPRFMKLVLEKIPFFILSFISCVITLLTQRSGGAVASFHDLPFRFRIENAVLSYVRYISKFLWPHDLSVFYPFPEHLPISMVLSGAGFLALCTWFAFRLSRTRPAYIVGWLYFLGTLVPTIGLVQVGSQCMADRYMYIPSIGLTIVLVWGISDTISSKAHKAVILGSIGFVVLGGFFAMTFQQLGYWSNSVTLFEHSIDVTKDNSNAYEGLGLGLEKLGRIPEAVDCFQKAVKIDPTVADNQYNLGTLLLEKGDLAEAVRHLKSAAELNPKSAQVQINLGKALLQQGMPSEAKLHFAKAVQFDPDSPVAHYNLGTALMMESRFSEAVEELQKCLQLNPSYDGAQANMGVALIRLGDVMNAASHFAEAARLNPTNAQALFNYGLALLELKKFTEAEGQFRAQLRLAGENPQAHYRLGLALEGLHEPEGAVKEYRLALHLDVDFPEALNDLAWLLATDPDAKVRSGAEAVQLASRACAVTGDKQPRMLLTLSAAYAASGRFDEASATVRRAEALGLTSGEKDVTAQAEAMEKLFRSGRPFVAAE